MSSISSRGSFSSFTSKGKKDLSSSPELRLVLLGKTGSGKSSTGNSILGCKAFEPRVSSSSATQRCRRACGDFRGRRLTLLDTPGLLGTHQPPLEVQRELRRSVALLFPGPQVFLLVVAVGRFTQAEKEAVRRIRETFGPRVLEYSVVVFTHGDSLEEGVAARDCLIEGSADLAELVAGCGGRYCVFNNHAARRKEQVSRLLTLVDGVLEAHEGGCFTHTMLLEAEEETERAKEEEERAKEEATRTLREEEGRRKQEQEKAVRQWYQGQLKMVELKTVEELEEMRRSRCLDRERMETFVREKEEALRVTREENVKKEKEWKVKEVMQMMAIRMEEEKKREALRMKLDNLAKTLEVQTEREQKVKRDMEEMIQKEKQENERRERAREQQQLQKEQAIRRREEVKREALQQEQDRLTQELEEQRRKEEEREKQIANQINVEREESQMERQREMENLEVEKKRNNALQRQLWLITMKLEECKTGTNGKAGSENNGGVNNNSDKSCPERGDTAIIEKPIEDSNSLSTSVRPVSGYVHEMGLVVINAGLEHLGSPCSIQ